MFTLICENQYGEQLELTHNPAYSIVSVDGIDPPDSTINTTHNANQDGSIYNSSYINNRTITITLAINSPAEENRIDLYRYFKSKFPVVLHFKNGTRDVYINGYVQSIQIAYFDRKQTAQIVILCPRPLFNGTDLNIQEFANANPLFEFPFAIEESGIPFSELIIGEEKSIINYGDIETGVLFTIHAIGSVVNPKIYNTDTNEHMIFNISLVAGDTLTVNTRQGEKSIILNHNGTETNEIGSLANGSTWFVLKPADNVFTTTADVTPENMIVTFYVIDQYEGV